VLSGSTGVQRVKLSFLKRALRIVLRMAGKSERKVVAVFGLSPQSSGCAVRHIRAGVGEIPVWLFCTSEPEPGTVELCERVFVRRSSVFSLFEAQGLLWPHQVALSVGTWTGENGAWSFKLAPFLIPPFRTLLVNRNADFVNGNSVALLVHVWRCLKEGVWAPWYSLREAVHDASDAVSLAGRRAWGKALSARHTIGDTLRAGGVRAAAILFRLTGSPHRTWFRTMHGSLQLEIMHRATCARDAIHLQACGRDWHGSAIEAQVASTDSRWLIWNERGGACPLDSLLPLLENECTFAVSVQRHFRGWSPSMVFTAPFRQLQPDEAACVLAPLSDVMVVDRAKLAALPIPRCGLSATAWLEIFWRAASAGWRSYSVGQDTPLTPQPEYPAPEAEFFLRSLLKPGLRHLGPQNPELMRGNLAFCPSAPAQTTSESGRLRVLVVSPFLPFPLSHGGAVRIWNLCRALRDRVDFALIAIRERDECVDYETLGEVFREVHTVDMDEFPSGTKDLPQQVRHHQSGSLAALIRDVCGRLQPDLIQIEYTHLAHFLEAQSDIPYILVEHDITFSLYSQLMEAEARLDARIEYVRWLAYERTYLRRFDSVWTMSDEDRRIALREGSRADATFTVPNGVDTGRFIPRRDLAEEPEILYVGSFRHLPNLIGFEILCREVMPRVWRRCPGARLRVVAGPQHEMFWQRFRGDALANTDARIHIHGFISDLRPLYASASVVAVPLAVSAGTNIKVLEAMACGKALVSTPVGCAGLGLRDGEELLVRESSGFAPAICDLLENHSLRANLGSVARRTAEQRFSWKAIADRAYQSYLDVWAPVAWNAIRTKAS
jgi:glycosyltransferase involved in cell wall biosynthesis